MANLENNNENENKKSVAQNIEDSVQKGVENVQETVKSAKELATDAIKHPVETASEIANQAARDVVSVKWWARLLQVLFWGALFLVVSFIVVINLPITKNWAAQKVMSKLNEDLKSKISFDSIDVNYFGDVTIYNVSVKDNKNFPFLKAKELYADSNWFSIISNSRSLLFQSMSLDELDLKVITYKGDSISNFIRFVDLFDNGKPSMNKVPFQLKSRIFIKDSKVSIVNENTPGEAGKWMDATNVNLIVPELRVKGPEVFAQINNLRFTTERWGKKHIVETFTTNLSLNKKFLFLDDLTINTDHTLLQGAIKFNLNEGKWTDFADKVRWEMSLKQGSQLNGYDISYFVTNWDNFKPFNVSGKMDGPLNNFTLENFLIRNPEVNIRTEKMKVDRLLKGDFKIETNSLSTDFTYKELKAMMPTFVASKMKNFADDFGRLKYSGAARVTPKQVFVSNANLIAGIGQAQIKEFYLNEYSSAMPRYNGYVEVDNLNTSVITKNKQVRVISGKFNLNGQSFDVNTMRLQTTSQISKIEILDKVITNVYLDGLLDHKQYNGLITVNSDQAKGSVKGLIDFRTSRILADIKADISTLNINYFTGQKGSQNFSGFIDGKIAMKDINDMNLDANLNQVSFSSAGKKYTIPNGNVKAFFENGNRIVTADMPGAVVGKISGKYNLGDLAGMIENGLGKILVGPAPRKLYKGQNFAMNFKVEQALLGYFVPDIVLPNGADMDGSYDGNSNNLVLNVETSKLLYILNSKQEISEADKALAKLNPDYVVDKTSTATKDSIIADNLIVRINTANQAEQIFARIDRVEFNDNILREVSLSGRNDNGNLLHLATNFKLGTPQQESENNLKEYAINLNQTTNEVGDYVFRFEPTQVKFNQVVWNVDTNPDLDHSITYRKGAGDFIIKNLRIYSDDSSLLVKNSVFKSGDDFEVDADVHNFQIGKIFDMQSSGNPSEINGLANGSVFIRKNNRNLQPVVDFKVDGIKMNNQDLGDLIITAKASSSPNVFDVDARLASAGLIGNNNLHLTGTVNNNTPSPTLDLTTELDDFDLGFSQQFVNSVFSNMRGKATGNLKITGPMNDIDYNGDVALKNFGLKLNFTGVDYSFDDNVISLSKGLALLNNIGVKDGRTNSGGSISGYIRFETLSSMEVGLFLEANNLMVLNTTQKDFDLFWGRVYGQGFLTVSGPVSGLKIETDPARPFKALNNSVFTFNSNSTSSVEEFKMLRFLKQDDSGQISVEEKKRSGANIEVDLLASVDKGTTVNVLVGDDIGNISVRGATDVNNLRFRMQKSGNISMRGNYIVDNGTFVSKAILERTFQITKGSSIQWDENPMSPDLNINATYLRTVSNANQYLQMSNIPPINTLLTANITGKLNNPDIQLGVEAQDVSSQVKEAIAQKMENKDERIIQFGSILVLNSFNVSTGGFGIDIGKSAESTGYNMLFKQLGSVLNTISNEFQVDLNYLSGDAASNTGDRANASVSFSLSPRVTVKTGLGIPITRSENTAQNFLSGEGIIEYDWSKNNDGTRIIRAYSKPSNIGMIAGAGNTSANQSYGAGVVYSKSFNSLFKRKEKNKKNKSTDQEKKKDSIKNDSLK